MDLRVQAFVSGKCPEIFHPIQHTNDIWRPDPFDIGSIHQEARETFGRLVEQALEGQVPSGRILVIRGEAGSGKTHLMRAFRNAVHDDDSAFFAYMQMTTSAQNYERYVLQNVINSLQQPYRPSETRTSLSVLSDRLADMVPRRRVEDLRDCSTAEAGPIVHELTDRLLDRNDLPPVDPDLIRALLFLQIGRPSVTTKVNKYLRAEALSDHDRETLGGIAPVHPEDAPLRNLRDLAQLIRTPLHRALVVCVDQLEDIFNLDESKERFPRAMSVVTSLAELPSVVVIVSCLEQFYINVTKHLSLSTIHRLEQDPAPVTLAGMRTRDEAQTMIARRLNRLWEEVNLGEASDSITPFPPGFLSRVEGLHARAILAECSTFRQRAVETQCIPPLGSTTATPPAPVQTDLTSLTQTWNDLCNQAQLVPIEEEQRRDLLCDLLRLVGDDIDRERVTTNRHPQANALTLSAGWSGHLHLAVTEANSKGGALLRQMRAAQESAQERTLVLVRSDPFTKTPKSQTMTALGEIVSRGGRGVIVSDADWRHLVAFQLFHSDHHADPKYAEFRRSEKPLWSLKAIKDLFDADNLVLIAPGAEPPRAEPTPTSSESASRPKVAVESPPAASGEPLAATPETEAPSGTSLSLGTTQGHRAKPVSLEVADLLRHAAFLGSTGSGKTTAAMMVVEQLLARKIPAVLIDRKGDLCGYGLPEVWTKPLDDPERAALRDRVRQAISVQLFTPGAPRGRNLGVPLVPAGLADLPQDERSAAANTSADGLAAMMNYGNGQTHRGGRAVIAKAIEYLSETGETPTLESLIGLLSGFEPDFVGSLNTLARFCDKTVTDLEILRAEKAVLLGSDVERLDVDKLLKPHPDGRVPLSIISTKFLGGESDVQFWVAQLLLQMSRWLDQNPKTELQGVVMLDEADLYLPATRSPASKKPIENLLRRARSKGLSVLLATQSPGDLDYKCRDNIVTWLVGLVGQETALRKLEPMFRDSASDTSRLASQKVGEFHLLQQGSVQSIKTRLNAVPLPSQVPDEDILRLARESVS